ncbi:hypothetical protein K388_01550 [Streptomyces sp. KhCrAH-43]|nr:hypothetical protein K388_01550 [Streptomyces sp. KhCrAH-43]
MLVGGAARPADERAVVAPLSGRGVARCVGVGLVARPVVRVPLAPPVCLDVRDPAYGVQRETPCSRGQFAYLGEVAVRAVGVGALLEEPVGLVCAVCGEGFGDEAVALVPRMSEGGGVSDAAFRLTTRGVVGEGESAVAPAQPGGAARRVVGPVRAHARGGGARGAAAHGVVRVRAGAAVDRLRYDSADRVEGEAQCLAHRVRLGRETARRVAFVGAGGAVEVGLRDQVSRRIVGVTPLPALRVGDPGQAQLGVAVLVLGAYGRGVRNPTSRRVPPPHPPQRGPYWAALRHTVTSIVT